MRSAEGLPAQGGCLCGQVRFTITSAVTFTGLCHCKHCQRQSGSAFALIVAVPRDSFSVVGMTRTFHDRGDSGHSVERVFCPNCGSPLYLTTHKGHGLVYVKAGTLDDTATVRPTVELFKERSQHWLRHLGFDPIGA